MNENIVKEKKQHIFKDQELKKSEPKSSPQNQNRKIAKIKNSQNTKKTHLFNRVSSYTDASPGVESLVGREFAQSLGARLLVSVLRVVGAIFTFTILLTIK